MGLLAIQSDISDRFEKEGGVCVCVCACVCVNLTDSSKSLVFWLTHGVIN